MRSGLFAFAGLGLVALFPTSVLAEKAVRRDHVMVSYEGVDEAHASAVAKVVESARRSAAKFGFDVPETIAVNVSARLTGGAGLFNDGDRGIFLTVRSDKDFRKPSDSGVFVVYGLCHEVGHLAMYRAIRERRWMTTAAAEGWAHYLGSRLVDAVYEAEGDDLWPDRYDYREDGTKRLKRQREDARSSTTVRRAALWADFVDLVGDKGVIETFAAWGKTKIDLSDPAKALGTGLPATDNVRKWWVSASPVFVAKSAVSPFAVKTAKPADLAGKPRVGSRRRDWRWEAIDRRGRARGQIRCPGRWLVSEGGAGVRIAVWSGRSAGREVHCLPARRPVSPNRRIPVCLCQIRPRRLGVG